MKIQLEAKDVSQKRILAYLEENVSEILAEKINGGARIEKDGKILINKKDLSGFMNYANQEARKLAAKGANSTFVDDDVVYGWAVHYFEEDSIEGTLYNEDGTKYEKPKVAPQKKTEKSQKKEGVKLIPVVARDDNEKKETETPSNKPQAQISLFDFSLGAGKNEEVTSREVAQEQEDFSIEQTTPKEETYEVYEGEIPEEMDLQPVQVETVANAEETSQSDEYEIVEEFSGYELEDSPLAAPTIEPEQIKTVEEGEKHWISDTMYVDDEGEVHIVEEDIIAKEKEFAKAFEIGALALLDEMFGSMLAMG